MQTSIAKFEALLYSANPRLAEQYASSFADLPANWMCFNEPETAADFLAKEHFDFIVLDLESANGRSLLQQLCDSGTARQSVILAVTGGTVDASTLSLCYEFCVFYPVRPNEIRANLHRSLPVAERFAQDREAIASEAQPVSSVDEEAESAMPSMVEEVIHTSKAFAWLFAAVATSIFCMKHSLGITAQERVASVLSGVASIWFVQESTANFKGLLNMGPPSAGPSYLLALSILLWLCAKQRRANSKGVAETALRN